MIRLICMLILVMPALVQAQTSFKDAKIDGSKPIDIKADTLTVRTEENVAIFKGNVDAVQDALSFKAEQMDVHYHKGSADGSLSKIEAQGDVLLTLPERTARSNKGRYDVDKGKVLLVGDVVLVHEDNTLRGDRFIYDLNTGESQLLAGNVIKDGSAMKASTGDATKAEDDGEEPEDDGRVRGLFVPKKK